MGAKGVEINAPFGCGHQLAMATNQPIKVAKGVENKDNGVGLGQDTHIPFPSQLHTVISHPYSKLVLGQVDLFPSLLTKWLITSSSPCLRCTFC